MKRETSTSHADKAEDTVRATKTVKPRTKDDETPIEDQTTLQGYENKGTPAEIIPTDDTVSMDDLPGNKYPHLSNVFFRGGTPGQIRSAHKAFAEGNKNKAKDFKRAVEDGAITLNEDDLTIDLVNKLAEMGIQVGDAAVMKAREKNQMARVKQINTRKEHLEEGRQAEDEKEAQIEGKEGKGGSNKAA